MLTLQVRSRPEGAPRPREADASESAGPSDRGDLSDTGHDTPAHDGAGHDSPAAEQDSPAAGPAVRSSSAPPSRSAGPDRHGRAVLALVVATVALALAALSVLTFSAVAGPSAAAAAAAAAATSGGASGGTTADGSGSGTGAAAGQNGTGQDGTGSGGTGAAADGLVGPVLLIGRVTDVPDPGTVVVAVQNRSVPVSVVGVDFSTTPPCAAAPALDFARRTLVGQTVTLVPDGTQPATTPTGARRAYVVLPSQFSYTDAALTAGWALPGDGQYRAVFEDELAQAQDDRAGMWGPPCRRGR